MTRISEIIGQLEAIAPPHFAFAWDRIGLLIGDPEAPTTGMVVALDATAGAMDFAQSHGANLLIVHHPLIWDPVRRVEGLVWEAARRGLHVFAAHTNWDCAEGGVSDALAEALGVGQTAPFGSAAGPSLKLVTFVPTGHVDPVLDAVSAAGAGVIGDYARCAFLAEGFGTYEAGAHTRPFAGEPGKRHIEPETRLEMILPEAHRRRVEQALRAAHPYEEPAYDFLTRAGLVGRPAGRVGELAEPMEFADFVAHIGAVLGGPVSAFGFTDRVQRVAVAGGAASGEWRAARAAGAEVLVTGEAKHNEILECEIPLILVGHYESEQPGMAALARRLDCPLYVPPPGEAGRSLEALWSPRA